MRLCGQVTKPLMVVEVQIGCNRGQDEPDGGYRSTTQNLPMDLGWLTRVLLGSLKWPA